MIGQTPRSAAYHRRKWLESLPADEWVYFIRVGHYIKVGYSRDPQRRMENLFSSSTRYSRPCDLSVHAKRELLGTIPGDKSDERRVHMALWNFAVGCEWFVDEPPVRDYMARGVVSHKRLPRAGGPVGLPSSPIPEWLDDVARMVAHSKARAS